ncbi:MAG TPA: hypothetical protein VLE43_18115 [Candidatus Saccharimonadia bacterium]|nr:hypothetical protein [Candidatus Saccharimonadia bacterium]
MKLDHLYLWHDTVPHAGPLNMAIDEVLLHQAKEPWLRCYAWSEPSVSIGFSQDPVALAPTLPPFPVVRRWTGGGVVIHDGDWTYTLIVPRDHPFCELRPVETYRLIHVALIEALAGIGIDGCELQPVSTSEGRGVCFVEPAMYDVVRGPDKIAGAAQRRSRLGFLHQASVQNVTLPGDFGTRFAGILAEQVTVMPQAEVESQILAEATKLSTTRYGAASWLEHRRDLGEPIPGQAPSSSSTAVA